MKYIKVKWIHNEKEKTADTPIWMYSELDAKNWEVRKVEEFFDGHLQYADSITSIGDTSLGLEPVPSISEINTDPSFLAEEMQKDDFEAIWQKAKKNEIYKNTLVK